MQRSKQAAENPRKVLSAAYCCFCGSCGQPNAVKRNSFHCMPKDDLTPQSLRLRAGLTQREVAIALNKRESTISDWERGAAKPKLYLREVKVLMKVYKASLEELIEAFDRP